MTTTTTDEFVNQSMYDLVHTGSVYLNSHGYTGYYTQETLLDLTHNSVDIILGTLDLNRKNPEEILAAYEELICVVDIELRSILRSIYEGCL